MNDRFNKLKLVGKRFCELKDIEECIFKQTGLYASVFESEGERLEQCDFLLDFELYETLESKQAEYEGGYDGEVHEMYYLKDNAGHYYITEVD